MAGRVQFENKTKTCHFFNCSIVFLGLALSADGISANPEKVKNWLVPTNPANNQTGKNRDNEPMVTQNKENFMWTGEHQEVFDLLNLT